MTDPRFQRAALLHEQGRDALAEPELRRLLGDQPENATAHALLALVLVGLDRLAEGTDAARSAIHLEPALAFAHYAHAVTLWKRNRPDEALVAVEEALRQEPSEADYHALRAAIYFDLRCWPEALAEAEAGLQFDSEHVYANNLRAMALVKLGRKAEAGATIDATLARAPESAWSHANKGWTLLEQGRRRDALTHFRESLRLDPNEAHARAGVVEALKAGNPVYAVMLRYFLWMAKLSGRAQGALVLGGYFGNQLLRSLAASHPAWRPWIGPVLGAYTVFALLTWLAQPFFNLLLWLHPVGRHALDDRQREQAEWVGCCLGMALLSGIGWFWLRPDELRGYGTILWVGLAIPVAAIWNCAAGWPRTTMRIYALGVAFFVVSATALIWWPSSITETQRAMKDLAQLAVIGGGAGCFIGQWVAMGLSHMRPKL